VRSQTRVGDRRDEVVRQFGVVFYGPDLNFFVKAAERDLGKKLSRERRRKEATGTPLSAHSALPALAPPQ